MRPAGLEPAPGKRNGPEPVSVDVGDTTEGIDGGIAVVGGDRLGLLAVGEAEGLYGEGGGACGGGVGGHKVVNRGTSVNKSG